MPNPWHEKRRSVEEDYRFYDPPQIIYKKITKKKWPYSEHVYYLENSQKNWLRDLAYMCLMYGSTCRASELCRFERKNEYGEVEISKPSVTKDQFQIIGDYLVFREAIILKRKEPIINSDGDILRDEHGRFLYQRIMEVEDYPKRAEIMLPLVNDFSVFTEHITEYLDTLGKEEELFPFKYRRGWQIVNYVTGEMQHYLRDMGIKFYARLVDRNMKDLKDFTGHARLENLSKYLGEGQLESKIKNVKF